jgi:predicted RNase H-like nuclease (RuvC/YqgF family)
MSEENWEWAERGISPNDKPVCNATTIKELTEENQRLKKTIANLRKQLESFQKAQSRQARYDSDYLPYGDDEYDR